MTLLQRLKSILGFNSARDSSYDDDVGVTLEHEASQSSQSDEPTAPEDTSPDTGPRATTDEPTTGDSTPPAETSDAIDVIDGIGPAYSDRLSDAGIETVAELAAADPQSIADETDISPARIERWIEQAKERS